MDGRAEGVAGVVWEVDGDAGVTTGVLEGGRRAGVATGGTSGGSGWLLRRISSSPDYICFADLPCLVGAFCYNGCYM